MIPQKIYQGHGQAPESGTEVTQTYYGKMEIKPGQPVSFMFLAGWEKQNPQYTDLEYFKQVLQQRADRMKHKIELEEPGG